MFSVKKVQPGDDLVHGMRVSFDIVGRAPDRDIAAWTIYVTVHITLNDNTIGMSLGLKTTSLPKGVLRRFRPPQYILP